MRFLYLMDPLEGLLPTKDTTLALMREAQARGHENLHARPTGLHLAGGVLRVRARRAVCAADGSAAAAGEPVDEVLAGIDAVLIRKDPPFDNAYLYMTLLLERARGETFIMNDPRGLRDANEKLYALNFPAFCPRSIVSAERAEIHAFVREVGGRAVIKPLDGCGGWGVLGLTDGDLNARAIVDLITDEGRKLAVAQEFLPAVREGDKRILVLDGAPLGAILRVPRPDELRANIHVGGSVVATELSGREQELVAALAPRLRADGLYFVGLDVIGERLTEVNVTSPTGIQELARLSGGHPEAHVVDWIEMKAAASRR